MRLSLGELAPFLELQLHTIHAFALVPSFLCTVILDQL